MNKILCFTPSSLRLEQLFDFFMRRKQQTFHIMCRVHFFVAFWASLRLCSFAQMKKEESRKLRISVPILQSTHTRASARLTRFSIPFHSAIANMQGEKRKKKKQNSEPCKDVAPTQQAFAYAATSMQQCFPCNNFIKQIACSLRSGCDCVG